MAFSKTPSTSTYQTKKISLIAEINSRGSVPDKDVDYLNCFPEIIKNKNTQESYTMLRKRSGCSSFITTASSSVRAMHYWEDRAKLYIAVGNNVAIYSMPAGTLDTTLVNVFPTTSTGKVGIVEFLYDTGAVKLVVTDGITLSTIDSANTVVAGADADMPVHLPSIVFLDGYIFMIKTSSADLYNSNLNDPLAYTAGDFISSEMFADQVTDLIKLNNYLLVFGNDSIEYFWDAANASGSPLQRNDTPIKLNGLIGGIAQLGNKVYFVGDANRSQPTVYMLEDFKITPIASESMRRFLSGVSNTMFASIVSIDGRDFYVLNAGTYTFVLELENNLWVRWGFGATGVFGLTYSANIRNGSTYSAIFHMSGTSIIYKFGESLYQDSGSSMTVSAVLNNEEYDTYNRKYMYRLTVWADRPTSTSSLLIQWTDDDYQTYNSGVSIDLNQSMPSTHRLGLFRKRAFKITHTANQPLRIKSIEVDINMGQT